MAPRVLRYACTRCTHLLGFDRLASKSEVAKKQSLQYHIKQEHLEVVDRTVLKRKLPRVDRRRSVFVTQVAKPTRRVHKRGNEAHPTTTSRPSIMFRFTQRANGETKAMEEVRLAVSEDDDTISVDTNEMSPIPSELLKQWRKTHLKNKTT